MRIKFVVEVQPGKGLGHFYRSVALAEELEKRGHSTGFTNPFHHPFPAKTPEARGKEWELVIIDSISLKEEEIEKYEFPRVLLDDLGLRQPRNTTVINVSGVEKWARRGKARFGGLEFALYAIPPDPRFKNFKTPEKKVVVGFGGEGNARLNEKIYWKLTYISVRTFVFGASGVPHRCKPEDFLRALSVSHCGIINGGTSLYSALHALCFPVSVPQNPHQYTRASELARKGWCVLATPEEAVNALFKLNWTEVEGKLREARRIFDGNSVKRVADVVEEVVR